MDRSYFNQPQRFISQVKAQYCRPCFLTGYHHSPGYFKQTSCEFGMRICLQLTIITIAHYRNMRIAECWMATLQLSKCYGIVPLNIDDDGRSPLASLSKKAATSTRTATNNLFSGLDHFSWSALTS